jgi:YVTN family beta-propeller protein
MRALALFGILMTTLAASAAAQSPPAHKDVWVVVAKQQPGITLYDARTDEVICKAKTGVSPHEANFSLDGRTLYVPVYGSANVGQPGTDEHALHFISTADCRELAVMDTGEHTRPHAIAVGRSGRLYITSENRQSVAIIDPTTRTVTGAIPTGSSFTHFLAVTADETQIFTSNVMSKTISVLDVPNRKLVSSLDTRVGNQRMAISPNQQWFVSQLGQEKQVSFYRVKDAGLDFQVVVDGAPFVGRFTDDNRYYFVMGAIEGGLRVWKIDVPARKVVAQSTEPLGAGNGGLGINQVTGNIYISALLANKVSVLDPQTLKLVKQIDTEPTPDGIYFATVR